MSETAREKDGPYSTWLACLLLGFGVAWIAFAAVAIYVFTHPAPLDDIAEGPEFTVVVNFFALLLAAYSIQAAVRIRWRRRTWPVLTRVPKAALVAVLIGGAIAAISVYVELFAYRPNGTDWRVVVCGVLFVAAALSVVILMILRRRFFRTLPPAWVAPQPSLQGSTVTLPPGSREPSLRDRKR